MKTRFPIFIITMLAGTLTACNGMSSATPTLQGDPLMPTVAAKPTARPASQANVTCDKISLYLDPKLGSGYDCETIPEATGADLAYWDIHPEHTEVTLKNYAFTDSLFTPRIAVFPVQRYGELLPDLVPARLADLRSLIAGGAISSKELPLLPPFNSAQMFNSQAAVIPFQNGKGVRYLTQYAQGIGPINNQELFYTYQGLTTDGKYWVSAILPISSADLMADGKNPPNGQSMEDFAKNYTSYIANTTSQLNTQRPDGFSPATSQLDALVQSISVAP